MAAAHADPSDRAPSAAALKAATKKLKRAGAAAGKIRMSTAVPSLGTPATKEAAATAATQHPVGSAAAPALAHLPPVALQYMASQGFSEPTAAQTQVWEAAAGGGDVLAQV